MHNLIITVCALLLTLSTANAATPSATASEIASKTASETASDAASETASETASDASSVAASDANSEAENVAYLLEAIRIPEHEAGSRVADAARLLIGSGADNYYTSDSTAQLRVNTREFTPITFIDTSIALAQSSLIPGATLAAFEEALSNVGCRKGENNGFASIMWHSSDWIVDNLYRGNIIELTDNYPGARSKTKSLDYLSTHRAQYAALADDSTYDNVRMTEMGFRSHRIPLLPRAAINRKDLLSDLRNGDILVLIPNQDGEDIYQIGVVSMEDDGPHLIHFDPASGSVVKEAETLRRYFNLHAKYFSGFRWIRLKQ